MNISFILDINERVYTRKRYVFFMDFRVCFSIANDDAKLYLFSFSHTSQKFNYVNSVSNIHFH